MAANDEQNLRLSEQILRLKQKIKTLDEQEAELTAAQLKDLSDAEAKLAKILKIQEKRIKAALGTYTAEKQIQSTISSQVGEVSSLSNLYKGLKDTQIQNLKNSQTSLSVVQKEMLSREGAKEALESTLEGVSKLQGIQQKIAESGPDDLETQQKLRDEYAFQESLLADSLKIKRGNSEISEEELKILEGILKSQEDGLQVALKYGTIHKDTKEFLEGQINAYKKINSTVRGVLNTAKVIMSTPGGILGTTLLGAGKLVGKIGEVNKELGTSFSQIGVTGGLTALLFDDYVDNVKALNKELGSASASTGSLARNMSEVALSFGVSGPEAASLIGSFSRLNGNSTDIAKDMLATSKAFAEQNNLIPGQLMSDLAGSTEMFALHGAEGGKNLLKAAGYAQKLGVEMSTLEKITSGLLDFETSITSELELGAMLGRNINLDRARALAYQGDIAGATKATLEAIGGITEYNRMDYFARQQTAKTLGISATELDKMVKLQEQGKDLSDATLKNFEESEVATQGLANKFGGQFISAIGSAVIGLGQMGVQLRTNNLLKKSMESGATDMIPSGPLTKSGKPDMRFKANKLATQKSMTPGPQLQQTSKGASSFSAGNVLAGAAAMLIVAGAMWVLGKAVQEFGKAKEGAVGRMVGGLIAITAAVAGLGLLISNPVIGGGVLMAAGAMLVIAGAIWVLGKALQEMSTGFSMLSGIGDQIVGLVSIIPGIYSLAGAFTVLGASLGLLAVSGMAALPALIAMATVGAGLGMLASAIGIGGESSSQSGGEVWDEKHPIIVKLGLIETAIRETKDVYMDGEKVTARVTEIQDRSIINRANIFITR